MALMATGAMGTNADPSGTADPDMALSCSPGLDITMPPDSRACLLDLHDPRCSMNPGNQHGHSVNQSLQSKLLVSFQAESWAIFTGIISANFVNHLPVDSVVVLSLQNVSPHDSHQVTSWMKGHISSKWRDLDSNMRLTAAPKIKITL